MRPTVRLPLALSVSGLFFWLCFGLVTSWWTAILALAAPLLALRCLPLAKALPLALANVFVGMIAAHAVRTRGLAELPLEAAAIGAGIVAGVGLLARIVTTWKPRSGWLIVPAAIAVVDRALGGDLAGRFAGTALSAFGPVALPLAGFLLEGVVSLASVGNRQFPDPFAQSTRESGIRRAGLVAVATVFVVVIGRFFLEVRAELAGNDVVVAVSGAVVVALSVAAVIAWRRGAHDG